MFHILNCLFLASSLSCWACEKNTLAMHGTCKKISLLCSPQENVCATFQVSTKIQSENGIKTRATVSRRCIYVPPRSDCDAVVCRSFIFGEICTVRLFLTWIWDMMPHETIWTKTILSCCDPSLCSTDFYFVYTHYFLRWPDGCHTEAH